MLRMFLDNFMVEYEVMIVEKIVDGGRRSIPVMWRDQGTYLCEWLVPKHAYAGSE